MFVWHQRHPNLQALKNLIWEEGLVVIVHTDASGEDGWGVACGSVWKQGRWSEAELQKSINWKELEAYIRALVEIPHLLKRKLVLLKSDNTCAVHYVNAGAGRIGELADLAKAIRLQEVALGVESVAIHIMGESNVTADGLSRMMVLQKVRDQFPDRSLRRRLFRQISAVVGTFDIDALAADDGHNTQCPHWHSPSFSFFERPIDASLIWCFPPTDLLPLVLTFLDTKRRAQQVMRIVLLVPESPKALWFHLVQRFKRVARFRAGSDLSRIRAANGEWTKLPPSKVPYVVLKSTSV